MKITKSALILCLIMLGIVTGGDVLGKGLSVSPSSYVWPDVVVGKEVRCPANIRIKNDSKDARSYTLRIVQSSELNVEVAQGFKELPSRRWISFERKRVTVNPGEWVEVGMFIDVPVEEKNFNQKWDFFVEVKEYTSGGEMFALATYSRFYVVTEDKKADIKKERDKD